MTVVAMSHGELSRFDTLMRVERGELRVDDAAALLGLKRRQIFRLLDRLRTEGAAVRRQIELRRSAYLLKFTLRAGGPDGPLFEFLHSLGLKTLGDIVSHLPRDAAKMRELASTPSMRATLDRLERVRLLQT